VQQCQDLPGHELFQYVDEPGHRQTIDSADVNAYLREIGGDEFTAKDFRTWAETVLAATTLGQLRAAPEARPTKAHVVQAVAAVAERLRNTPSICRKCYIHPAVIEAYQDSTLAPPLTVVPRGARRPGLQPVERAVLRLLKTRRAAERSVGRRVTR
jgi:DNA topoisomerase-1